MARLYPVVFVILRWAMVVFSLHVAAAQDYCSLKVRVLTPEGVRPEAPIVVVEQHGRSQEKEHGEEDVAFCDLGILPVTVRVGSDGLCNQVVVRDVPMLWNETYLLTVTYDPGACMETLRAPIPICTILFRVNDTQGRWIPKAPITIVDPAAARLTTDKFGRALFTAKAGDKVHAIVDAQGFRPADTEFTCSRSDLVGEYPIQLEPQARWWTNLSPSSRMLSAVAREITLGDKS